MTDKNKTQISFFGIKKFEPWKQGLFTLALGAVLVLAKKGSATGEDEWMMAAIALTLFSWLNPIMGAFKENFGKYFLQSLLIFIAMGACFYFLVSAASSISFAELGPIRFMAVAITWFFVLLSGFAFGFKLLKNKTLDVE